jgi:hypothetical protein
MILRRNGEDTATLPREGVSQACPACDGPLEPEDAFCLSCGSAVTFEDVERAAQGETSDHEAEAETRRYSRFVPERRSVRIALVATLAVLIAAALSLLAVAWQVEKGQREDVEQRLAVEQAHSQELTDDIGSLRVQLAETEAKLAVAEELAEARGRVLDQTRKVLRSVDPLLSSVDELQRVGAQIQDDRDTFADTSTTFISDAVDFTNYLLGTDPFDYNYSYMSSQIDYLNDRLDEVNAAVGQLDERDTSYAAASRRFASRADQYSAAVRRLQRELEKVVE